MLLLYLLLTPHRPSHYRLTSSLDDVALFSLLRAAAVALAYLFGAGRLYHRCAGTPPPSRRASSLAPGSTTA